MVFSVCQNTKDTVVHFQTDVKYLSISTIYFDHRKVNEFHNIFFFSSIKQPVFRHTQHSIKAYKHKPHALWLNLLIYRIHRT